jgi:hypothetical protein
MLDTGVWQEADQVNVALEKQGSCQLYGAVVQQIRCAMADRAIGLVHVILAAILKLPVNLPSPSAGRAIALPWV